MAFQKSIFVRRDEHSSVSLLKQQFSSFVRKSNDLNKNSYGEILFHEIGRKPTYAPYITASSNTNPQVIWTLFTRHWNLTIPQVIISTTGEFVGHNPQWMNTTNNSWIFTNGSSPLTNFDDACIIAIVQANSFEGSDNLYNSESFQGSFPAVYAPAVVSDKKLLDSHHTHFIFVEGDPDQVEIFRINLLEQIGLTPIEFDSTGTKFVEIPVVGQLTSDSPEELLHVVKCSEMDHPVVVNITAADVYLLLENVKGPWMQPMTQRSRKLSSPTPTDKSNRWSKKEISEQLQSILGWYESDEDKKRVEQFFKNSVDKPICLFPSSESQTLESGIINAVVKSNRHSIRTTVRLSLMWGHMDIIKETFSLKNLNRDKTFLPTCLFMALFLSRTEFLEILRDLGINIYETLTVRMLWGLYYKDILSSKNVSSMSYFVKGIIKERKIEMKILLREIGRIIKQFTGHECRKLYTDLDYVYEPDGGLNSAIDNTVTVQHPERDLFFWCILTGRDELATIIWKQGNELIATALCASTICKNASDQLKNTAKHSILAENLESWSKAWEEKAIQVLQHSYKINEEATLSQLKAKFPHLGGCSCLTIAHTGNRALFISQGPVHTCLDLIWNGHSSADKSILLIMLAACIPPLIPLLGVMKKSSEFTSFSSQIYQPKFSKAARNSEQIDAITWEPVLLPLTHKLGEDINWKTKLVSSLWDIFNFCNSPKITFIYHTIFLVLSIILMSWSVIAVNFAQIRSLHLYWILWYMLGNLFDEVRQIAVNKGRGVGKKLKFYLKDAWNVCDIVMLTTYFTGLGLLASQEIPSSDKWYASKVMMCLSLACLFLRVLQTYFVSKLLGPLLYTIRKMLSDVVAFLSVLAIVYLTYGIIRHAITLRYDEVSSDNTATANKYGVNASELIISIINQLLREPFWQILGESIDNATEPQNGVREIVLSALTGLYVTFTTILMINLLIAMFSYTFENIQEQTYVIWSYFRYDLTLEFAERPFLASPLIMFIHLYRLIYAVVKKRNPAKNLFKRPITPQDLELSREFESQVVVEITKREASNQCSQTVLKNLNKRQEAMELTLSQLTSKVEKLERTKTIV
ncbi:transient receptor potential cation channel subfamily M member-like 2 [Clavelina lepadiformis]|uniref:transient receptor potential cation channel subfamily M member-like 2 n=1 Tax=Clavelina lepadiformis TaxID=159417 RepID=UPI0040423395